MACSKYEYVKAYQQHRVALPQTYMIVRIDGRGFTKFCNAHQFAKPNDLRAINLMNQSAMHVCQKFKDIFLAYGQSDQYSFALSKNSELFSRRIDKIQTCIVSSFTSAYVAFWQKHFKEIKLIELPSFDARIIIYPNIEIVQDYFRWRQVDCHINNLYNTTFWCMVKKGIKNTEVQNILKDTNSGAKNQILFSQFGINYNEIQQIYRRGSLICYKNVQLKQKNQQKLLKISPKITKQLKTAIRQIKDTCSNTDKIINKLSVSQLQQDKDSTKQLQILRKQLQTIKIRFEKVQERNSKSNHNKMKIKDKENGDNIQILMCHDDMVKGEFWETIKIV